MIIYLLFVTFLAKILYRFFYKSSFQLTNLKDEYINIYTKKIVKKSNLKHIAFIIDGNRRWSKENKKSYEKGYLEGSNKLKKIIFDCQDFGIKYISVYAFSTLNFKRPKNEIETFMKVFIEQLKNTLDELMKKDIHFKFIGNLRDIKEDFRKYFLSIEEKTKENNGLYLQIAFNYTSREEITNAVKNIANKIINNEIKKENISEDLIAKELYTGNVPDPDMVIRTSGEKRISNFLLWQIAFSELFFYKENWPDFGREQLINAIIGFGKRKRNFGK